jgi:hypothetical protein
MTKLSVQSALITTVAIAGFAVGQSPSYQVPAWSREGSQVRLYERQMIICSCNVLSDQVTLQIAARHRAVQSAE